MSNIKEKSGLKSGQLIALIAIAALNILWLVCRLISFSGTIKLQTVAPIVMLVITAIYALYGYKKPHGNHVRYLLLINTVYVGILLIAEQSMQSTYVRAVNIPIIILSTYMAGRLDRYKQNLIISIVVLLLQIANI